MLLRLTLRTLWRSPWFTAACVGTVALSIALASTVFAVVDGVMFEPSPYPDSGRLMLLYRSIDDPVRREQLRDATGRAGSSISARDLFDWRGARPDVRSSAFLTNFGVGPVADTGLLEETTWAAQIDREFFDVVGIRPMIGGFQDADYERSFERGALSAHPAIISHRLWRRIAPANEWPEEPIRVGDGTIQIVGVLPPNFVFPTTYARTTPDILFPLHLRAEQRGLGGIARLPAGLSPSMASQQLPGAVFDPIDQALGTRERPAFRVTFLAVLTVVLLASLNVAVLLGARGRDRAAELAVRTALGASERRLVGILLSEAMVIALAGAVIGVLAAKPVLAFVLTMMPQAYLLMQSPAIDLRVVGFAILAATSTLLAFAAWPAVRAARASAYPGLREASRTTPSRGWRRVALAAQSAAGLVVVLAGTLLVAGFATLWQEDVGIDRSAAAIVEVTARAVPDPARREALLENAVRTAARIPGVERVTALAGPFLRNAIAGSMFAAPAGSPEVVVQDVPIGPGFFATSGIRLLSGRFPTDDELERAHPVVVVSERTARAFWPGREATGQLLHATSGVAALVTGVAADIRVVGLEERQPTGEIYLPLGLAAPRADRVLLLRSSADPGEAAKAVAAAIVREVPDLMITRAESLNAALAGTVRPRQFQAVLFGTFAAATLVLLAAGMFGAVAMNTVARTHEIGIRLALGATAASVRRMVVRENLTPVLIGVLLGGLVSWWTTTLLASLIYGVGSHHPGLWAASALLVVLTALAAAWLPAARTSRVDPQAVLRSP